MEKWAKERSRSCLQNYSGKINYFPKVAKSAETFATF